MGERTAADGTLVTLLERWQRRLRHLGAWTRAPLNAAAFALRRRLRWRRGEPPVIDEPKTGLFDDLPPTARASAVRREQELRERYRLHALHAASRRLDYRLNLYVLDVLERLASRLDPWLRSRNALRLLDIGSKDFAYATALERFFRWRKRAKQPRGLVLDGVELDGHVIYRDFYSRADYGHAAAARLGPHVRYHVMDIRAWREGPADVVTWFYPFLNPYPLLRWGLPLSCYAPDALLSCALSCVREGGVLITLHQTSEECARFERLLPASLRSLWTRLPAASSLMVEPKRGADRWVTLLEVPEREP